MNRVDRRAALPVHASLLLAPEILFRFVHVSGLSFLLLYRGETFPFLISHARSLSRFAAGEDRDAQHQSNESKVLHVFNYITNSGDVVAAFVSNAELKIGSVSTDKLLPNPTLPLVVNVFQIKTARQYRGHISEGFLVKKTEFLYRDWDQSRLPSFPHSLNADN
jgi:hypothetical protein